LDNTAEIVKYYTEQEPSYKLMRAFHFISGRVFRVNTVFMPGAEQAISEHLGGGGQLLLAANHQKFADALMLASMFQHEKVFHSMRGKTTIPGNAPLFDHPVYGPIVSRSGAVPVFRSKDVAKLHAGEGVSREDQRKYANRLLVDIMIGKINSGMHGAYFPEGTRAKDMKDRDPRVLLPLLSGIGHTACGVDRPDNLLVMCTGIKFEETKHATRQATIAVAYPFAVAPTPEAVVAETGATLQRAVDLAFA
jgi:1-acyl-sn-glycerol-3-phosphate acyltransferase